MIRLSTKAKSTFFELLPKYIPENAVHYCFDLWVEHPFHFKVNRKRQTKLGDYRYDPVRKEHTITVNLNLNPYNFLITYLHEFAHLITTEKYGRKVSPHGQEWKNAFIETIAPVLNNLVFPNELLTILKKHMSNPKASSQSDPKLVRALRKYDKNPTDQMLLEDLDQGEEFDFKGNTFRKLETRRTRVLCFHLASGRKYLIPKIARIEKNLSN
jgi:hypothetical protein